MLPRFACRLSSDSVYVYVSTMTADPLAASVLATHDQELRLLDNMRTCIQSRVKCDREYATALQAISAHASKAVSG